MADDKQTIYQRVADVTKEISAIGKNKRNQQQGFNFRGIDDVYNAIQPILSRHEVFTIPEVIEDRTEERQTKSGGNLIYRVLKIRYTMFAPDGSSISGVVIGEGMDSGDKAANKAMAVGHKYFILQTFCVPTEDMPDPDAETHEVKGRNGNGAKKQTSFADTMAAVKEKVGDDVFAECLMAHGFNSVEQITKRDDQVAVFGDLKKFMQSQQAANA